MDHIVLRLHLREFTIQHNWGKIFEWDDVTHCLRQEQTRKVLPPTAFDGLMRPGLSYPNHV